jgi:hypothetical protein
VFDGVYKIIWNLSVQHKRKPACDPSKPRLDLAGSLKRREEEAANKRGHRHNRRTERNPSAASAVGRKKKG